MKTKYNRWLAAAMCAAAMCLGGQRGLAQAPDTIPDKVFIEDFSIAPGESKLVPVSIDNACWWYALHFRLDLPAGLEFEVINPEEIDKEAFTFETIYDNKQEGLVLMPEDQCMMAMSTNFANPEFMDTRARQYCEREKTAYDNGAEFIKAQDGTWWMYFFVVGSGHICFNGTQRIALLKLHATDELADDAEIHINKCVFAGQAYAAWGTGSDTQLCAKETVTRVRRVDPQPEVNCDVNGDGAVDINDVNTVINAVLKN